VVGKYLNAWEDDVILVWVLDQRGAPCPPRLALSCLECARVGQNLLATPLVTSHWLGIKTSFNNIHNKHRDKKSLENFSLHPPGGLTMAVNKKFFALPQNHNLDVLFMRKVLSIGKGW